MIPFPEKKYSVIYADPPWNYAAGGKTRNVERHYRTMKPEDIYSLPVQDIAEDDCLLFLLSCCSATKRKLSPCSLRRDVPPSGSES